MLHLSWWASVVGACILAMISFSNHPIAMRTSGGNESIGPLLVVSSLTNAAMTSAAALVVGRALGWIWGI
jgi:hypothetical protein